MDHIPLLTTCESNGTSRARLIEVATAYVQPNTFNVEALQNLLFAIARLATEATLSPPFAASLCHAVFQVSKGSKFIERINPSCYVGCTGADDPLLIPGIVCDSLFLLDVQLTPDDLFVDPSLPTKRAALVAFAKHINNLAFIPAILLMERLDAEFLEQITLISNAKLFQRKSIRINTNITYKQQKFNLLREESEGFAMLETHLAGSLPASFDVFWSRHYSNGALPHDQVHILWKDHVGMKVKSVLQHITSLIGYFDLNPNKVLDVILDVFIANVVDHWDFFVELLNQSHWQPVKTTKTITKLGGIESTIEVVEGSAVLGQILGFKYDYYNNVASTHVTPPQLLWITAILIKHRLVTLEDVYPHLSPADEDMEQELKAFIDKLNIQKKAGGKYKDTSLADAGALGDESGGSGGFAMIKERGGNSSSERNNSNPQSTAIVTTAVDTVAPSPPKPRKTNQKVVLASYLLALGSINEARKILDRSSVLVKTHPDVSDYMSRILDRVIEPIYETIRPIKSRIKPTLPPTQPPPMNTLNYKMAQSNIQVGRKINYPKLKFFYDKWDEGLPTCRSFDDLIKVLRLLLPYIAVSLDVVFVSKIARLGRAHLVAAPDDEKVKNHWLSIVAKFLFPALSMTDQNPGLSNDIWVILKLYPFDRRYALYGEWKHNTYFAIPQLGVAKAGCISDAKYTMRRLSKETVKRFGRYIGKIGHSNPTIAFQYILDLLQTYENQNATVVEGSRYMSELSFDVVTFTLVEQLSVSKERVQAGGIGMKTWLKSLSYFTGAIYKKHPIELGGILRYLFAQLVEGNTHDLILLQELVQQMCGIKAITDDVTADQYNALAAGEILRREAFGNEPLRLVKKVSGRLLRALMESELALPFAILMGQRIEGCVFAKDVGDIKILGWVLDSVRATFTQYMDFLVSHADREAYSALVPDIDVLRNDYKLTPDVAFAILRPKLQHITRHEVTEKPSISNAMDMDGTTPSNIHPNLLPILESVQCTLPESIWKILSPQFYITFWSLTLCDIDFPQSKYQSEIEKIKATIASLTADKSNSGLNTPAKRRKDIERHRLTISLLEKEMAVHETHVKKVMERLKRECLDWFASRDSADLSRLVILVMQHCVVPRSLFSPADALYGAKFMFLAQQLGVPNLMTLPFFDRILSKNNLQSMIYLCTEMEARNFGRFTHQLLQTLTNWLNTPSLYTKICLDPTHPGFALRWNPDPTTGKIPAEDLMSVPDFRKVMLKWHASMHKTITLCLESGDFSQITNGILILMKIQDYFPLIREHAQLLHAACDAVIAKETERKDLKLMCTAYSGRLAKMAKTLMSRAAFANGGVEPTSFFAAGVAVSVEPRLPSSSSSDTLFEGGNSNPRDRRDRGGNNERDHNVGGGRFDGRDRGGERDARGQRDQRDRDQRDQRDRDQLDRDRNQRQSDRTKESGRNDDRRNDVGGGGEKRIEIKENTGGRKEERRGESSSSSGQDLDSRRKEPNARDSPRRLPPSSRSDVGGSSSSPAKNRDDERSKREHGDGRGTGKGEDSKRSDVKRSDRSEDKRDRKDVKESPERERTPANTSAPELDRPVALSRSTVPPAPAAPAPPVTAEKPAATEDPLSKLREKVAKTMHHPTGSTHDTKSSVPPVPVGPERPPSQPPVDKAAPTSTPEQKPRLSIVERLGGRVDPRIAENSSSSSSGPVLHEGGGNSGGGVSGDKRSDKKSDRGDRRDRDRDRGDRGDRAGEKERDRVDKRDRKKSSRGDREEREDKPSKRDRSDAAATVVEREAKRLKVDESDVVATSSSSGSKKREADGTIVAPVETVGTAAPRPTSNIPEPPPPPPNVLGEGLESERHKRVKLDRNFDRHKAAAEGQTGGSANTMPVLQVVERETGNATVNNVNSNNNNRESGPVIVERQSSNEGGGVASASGNQQGNNNNDNNRDRHNNRNNSNYNNRWNRHGGGGGSNGGGGGSRDRGDRNGGYRR
ncbi:UNVERIFIED_CONTAM: THO complex subunit 2 [Siphonaria sp. JEL0065]|nr:THO complex subunit 2 [Siphonaria sp. JEL0065]